MCEFSEAQGFDKKRDVSPELLDMGEPWIKANFLTWGQPLSLPADISDLFHGAISGENEQELSSDCKCVKVEKVALLVAVGSLTIVFCMQGLPGIANTMDWISCW